MRSVMRFSGLVPVVTLLLTAFVMPAYATFPGQNGLITFSVPSDTGAQIYTVRPNGDDLRQITNVVGDALVPDWSPDGRKIVFEHDSPDSCNVALMNADGSGLVKCLRG
jgi:Tol biopolymer transport system component